MLQRISVNWNLLNELACVLAPDMARLISIQINKEL